LKRLRRQAARLAMAAAALLIAWAPAVCVAKDRHVLWAVAGQHNTVYLLGSIHVLRAEDGGLPQVGEDAYRDAERLVMEIDMDDELAGDPTSLAGTIQRMAMLPAGQSLRTVLGPDYSAVKEHAQKAGLDLAVLDPFAPWFVATALLQVELAKRGFSPELGVEQMIVTRAAADGKPIQGLETAEQQFRILAGLPMPLQRRFLLMTIEESDDLDTEIRELLSAWQSGDTARLARLLGDEFDEFPELYRPLTEDRNRAWIPEIVALLDDSDDYLVVVGALHLVGRNSVVDLLQQRGYRVTQQ
jgi:uncharacterized protein YbaP (TraB family)